MSTDHGRQIFERGHTEHRGKPRGAKAVAPEHGDLRPSKWSTSEPVPARENVDIVEGGRQNVPTVPSEEALPLRAPAGRSIFSPEQYRERKVPAGETLLSPKNSSKPKQRIEHFQSAENTAPRKTLKHHDRNENGTEPLHGKVTVKKLQAKLKSELKAADRG